jgi:thymidylate synthase (FAD)
MEIRFGEQPKTKYVNNLRNIKVSLANAPTMKDLRSYLVDFATATWEDKPTKGSKKMSKDEKDHIIYMIFKGKMLPSALETIRLTFLLEGISYQDVSHILRYRGACFSAECSADKWWSHKNVTVPTSIENSPEFLERYKTLHEDMKQLYVDMIDSKEVSLIDARYVLTRACETYYWMSGSLIEFMRFINHRIDKQIQPESDNIMAYRMWEALIDQYPLLVDLVDLHAPAKFYVETARTGRCTNLFVPDADTADCYDWNRDDYLYKKERSEINGTDNFNAYWRPFKEILLEVEDHIVEVKEDNIKKYGSKFFEV